MAFDPDAFLANSPQQSGGFDPDAFLSEKSQPQQPSQPGAFSKFLFGDPSQQVNDLDASNPLTSIGNAAKKAGSYIAEKGGEMFPNSPKVAAGIGTAVSMLPDVAGMTAGTTALETSENPIARGLTNTPQELGKEYETGAQAAGVSSNIPELRGSVARFPPNATVAGIPVPSIPPTSYPRDPATLVNFAQKRIQAFGDQLSPQELNDYKTMMGTILDKKFSPNTPPGAIASQVKNDATTLLNKMIPGRADLNVSYGISKSPLVNPDFGRMASYLVKKIGWLPVKIALGEAGAKGLVDLFTQNSQ